MIGGALAEALQRALGVAVGGSSPISGGDINDACALRLEDGRRFFLKSNVRAPASMFPAEARGLGWLAEARALRVPEVVAVSAGIEGEPSYLVLELLESGRRQRDFDERLGRGLARLHRHGAPCFGLEHDNFIGSLPQQNRAHETWPEFLWLERLEPQLALAVQSGRASSRLRAGFERLSARLSELVGPPEPPARLHGDLWGGNLHVDEQGAPVLIDPAVYGGHREVDLAMMRLFGGFGEAVFRAYEAEHPLAAGHAERVGLYQLYPLMVHVNLFGGSYAQSVEHGLARYV
jgi:fructosamine-3-kinase